MLDKEYVFYGKHAEMVEKMKGKLSDQIDTGFFKTNYDIYRIAPIVGWIYNRKGTVEKGDKNTKIFADKMMNENDLTVFNFRLLMILSNSNKNTEETIEIAFKLDSKDEERKPFEIEFNEYVLGGVEEMYERIFGDDSEIDDYLMNAYEFAQDLNVRIYNIMPKDSEL